MEFGLGHSFRIARKMCKFSHLFVSDTVTGVPGMTNIPKLTDVPEMNGFS